MALRGRRGEVLHIRNMNSVVFCLDALARNSNGRHGDALGTAAGAASLRAAPYRTDATGERALNSVVAAGLHGSRWLPIG
jgi:hypothetical protein